MINNKYKLSIRAINNKRNQKRWGLKSYWLYQMKKINEGHFIKVDTTHINSNVELNKNDIRTLVDEVATFKKKSNYKHALLLTYGVIIEYLKDIKGRELAIIESNDEILEIIKYVREGK